MLIACWSVKGGVGTTVVSAALGLLCGRESSGTPALLVDLAGDLPAALGVPEPAGAGVLDWLAADAAAPPDSLDRLSVPVTQDLSLVPLGGSSARERIGQARADLLPAVLAARGAPVVVDCGRLTSPDEPGAIVAAAATHSLLVTRACYLSLRRASLAPLRPSGVVVVDEPERSLGPDDVAAVVDVPIVGVVPLEPAVARAVDAGLLAARLPRPLARGLRSVA